MSLRALLVLALISIGTLARADSIAARSPVVVSVDSIGITVNDMDRAVDFYTNVLGFRKVAEREVAGARFEHLYGVFGLRLAKATLQLGEERIELMQFIAPRGRPTPVDSRSNDHWFQHIAIIVSDMDRAYAWLRRHKVDHASPGPQVLPAWNPNAGGIAAFYFRDPDGNHLEVLQFPADKGDPKWRGRTDRLFLGIDHTAIVVADTDASLDFYRDALGMSVLGGSENYGPEQERLNNVFGARLRITALRATRGPGVELLEYLAPRTGRPIPIDTQANDGWYWQVNTTADVTAADAEVRAGRYAYVSAGPQAVDDGRQMIVRDADGHAVSFRDESTNEGRLP
jgi:catechol 2,3-dioxygenase-like lactoylglutathione lyase family enzyme